MLEKEKFVNYTLDEDKIKGSSIVVPLKLNLEEQEELKELKKRLLQPKDSTAIKQLMSIGAKVLLDEKITHINELILNNFRKNKRTGIIEFD